MAVTSTPAYPQGMNSGVVSFVNADGAATVNATTNQKILITAGVNGTKVEAVNVSSNDTAARDVYLTLHNGTSAFTIAEFGIPISSGYGSDSVAAVDLLRSTQIPSLATDAMGNKYLYLPSGWKLYAGMAVAVTAAKQINVWAQGMDF